MSARTITFPGGLRVTVEHPTIKLPELNVDIARHAHDQEEELEGLRLLEAAGAGGLETVEYHGSSWATVKAARSGITGEVTAFGHHDDRGDYGFIRRAEQVRDAAIEKYPGAYSDPAKRPAPATFGEE